MEEPLENGFRVILGVCGGIAAYKALELLRLLRTADMQVQVVLTESAQRFIQPLSFEALSGQSVLTDLFSATQSSQIAHTYLGEDADLVVVAPATANCIAKFNAGMGDNLLSSLLLATPAPVLLCPAMNDNMWFNPAVQRNVKSLMQQSGVHLLPPEEGYLACGKQSVGRLPEPATIFEHIAQILASSRPTETPEMPKAQPLKNKRVLITAGATVEAIDPFRYISNYSSGKMGQAMAEAALALGAEVSLIEAKVHTPCTTAGITRYTVSSVADLAEQVFALAPQQDMVIMAAAVSDYAPVQTYEHKLKKGSEIKAGDIYLLELECTIDILQTLGQRKKKGQVLVGFAAETQDLEQNARQKLIAKHLDYIVGNAIGSPGVGFGSDDNEVLLLGPSDCQHFTKRPKAQLALDILQHIAKTWRGQT